MRNEDFEPLYYDFDACMAFLRALANDDTTAGKPISFHMYWKTVRPFGRKQILPIKSFLATQAYEQFRLVLWSNVDLTSNELLRPWLKYIDFRLYRPRIEAKGTLLDGKALLDLDDPLVYQGGDLFRALILHRYGGVYCDMDSVYMRDFRPLFEEEFMYKWSFQVQMISSAVMYLKQKSALSAELLNGILHLPAGGTNWGCNNNMRAFVKKPFRVFPCAFFNPEWQRKFTAEEKVGLSDNDLCGEPFVRQKFSSSLYEGSFVWHWHNRWENPIQPGCKFELLEALTDEKLKQLGLLYA